MEDIKREFKTNDFYQAVIIKTVGLPLLRLEKSSGRYFNFVFDDSQGTAQEIIERYWNRKVEVIARDLIENISELKSRIYAGV